MIAAIIVALLIGLSSDWFGLSSERSASVLSVSHVQEAGFSIDRNIVDGNIRVLNGQFESIGASILIPQDGQAITAGLPEVQRASQWQQLGGNWQALRAGEALVLCEPVPECTGLVEALARAVFED